MNRHVIQKQTIELSIEKTGNFHPLADAFTNMIKHTVMPRLSTRFDKLADEQTIVTADYLEIDLGVIDWEKQQDMISDRLVELITKKVSGLIDTNEDPASATATPVVPLTIRQWQAWKEYLQTGLMPWFGTTAATRQDWEILLIEILDTGQDPAIINIIHEVISHEESRKRLLLAFSSSFIDSIMMATGHLTEERLSLLLFSRWLESEMQVATGTFEKITRNILLDRLRDDNPGIAFIIFLEQLICLYPYQNWLRVLLDLNRPSTINSVLLPGIQKTIRYFISALLSRIPEAEFRNTIRIIPQTIELETHFSSKAFEIIHDQKIIADRHNAKEITEETQSILDKNFTRNKKKDEPVLIARKEKAAANESMYVPYAGLVIAAPFLPVFFEAVGLLENGLFPGKESQVKAVRLAGFLASGQPDTPDWDLTVPKILCGLEPGDTIETETLLDKESLQEGTNLLEAMIKHWTALGRSSPDGLRQGFLERRGKLTADCQLATDNWLVEVEAKTIDILLNRIPWGFGTIKLSWMTKMVRTEWQGYL